MQMNKKKLYIMCGAPGSGKTTYIQTHIQPKEAVISRDNIRFGFLESYGDSDYFRYEKEVFKTYISNIQAILDSPEFDGVWCDSTCINEASRNKLLDALNLENVDKLIAVVVRPSLEVHLKQNSQRTGWALVPDEAIIRMYNAFTYPSFAEKHKYNKIIHVGDLK